MESEVWRPVEGFPCSHTPHGSAYEVSNLGRVRSFKKGLWTRRGFVPDEPTLLTLRSKEDGYQVVALSHRGKVVMRQVHRLVLTAFVGPCPPGHETDHVNGITSDNRLENLEWVTPEENYRRYRELALAH